MFYTYHFSLSCFTLSSRILEQGYQAMLVKAPNEIHGPNMLHLRSL